MQFSTGVDIKERIEARPISCFQWKILFLCFVIIMFYGYDMAVMAPVPPARMKTLLLVEGPQVESVTDVLNQLGKVSVIKMCRSVALCTVVLFSVDSSTRLANCVSLSPLLAGQQQGGGERNNNTDFFHCEYPYVHALS